MKSPSCTVYVGLAQACPNNLVVRQHSQNQTTLYDKDSAIIMFTLCPFTTPKNCKVHASVYYYEKHSVIEFLS